MWTRWCLGKRDPWLWVIFWLLEGQRKWTRPALLAYWAALGCLSVAAWTRQLARSRRYWPRSAASDASTASGTFDAPSAISTPSSQSVDQAPPSPGSASSMGGALGMTFPNMPTLPNLPNGAQVTNAATDFLDAADKHVPTLTLNARRKFFHALAVVMFIPGVALDVRGFFMCSIWILYSKDYRFFFTAGLYASVLQCRLCDVYFHRIRSIFCDLSVWGNNPCIHERVSGSQR